MGLRLLLLELVPDVVDVAVVLDLVLLLRPQAVAELPEHFRRRQGNLLIAPVRPLGRPAAGPELGRPAELPVGVPAAVQDPGEFVGGLVELWALLRDTSYRSAESGCCAAATTPSSASSCGGTWVSGPYFGEVRWWGLGFSPGSPLGCLLNIRL